MQKKLHTYITLLLLGAFLVPSMSFACGISAKKACCKKEMSAKSEKKKCCEESPSKKEHKGCEGKCGHSNCTSASVSSIFAIFDESIFSTNSFDFSNERPSFYDSKTFISSGFSSLWLIPKIG
ncbi:hypothetical protein [Flavobacterium sp. SM2513]|uniref:hypothetical protein n=1 Tax=Flavobacterium sp. SM2513 TaxID=3424766 RepID=UPI003D7F2093